MYDEFQAFIARLAGPGTAAPLGAITFPSHFQLIFVILMMEMLRILYNNMQKLKPGE